MTGLEDTGALGSKPFSLHDVNLRERYIEQADARELRCQSRECTNDVFWVACV